MTRFQKGIVAALFIALLVAAAGGLISSTAAVETSVGYVDKDAIVDEYAGPQISSVVKERDRLQKKFDEESKSLDAQAKKELFSKYEEQLKAFETKVGIRKLMADVDAAFKKVAEENGVDVIVEQSAVVYGGVDLTQAIRKELELGK